MQLQLHFQDFGSQDESSSKCDVINKNLQKCKKKFVKYLFTKKKIAKKCKKFVKSSFILKIRTEREKIIFIL